MRFPEISGFSRNIKYQLKKPNKDKTIFTKSCVCVVASIVTIAQAFTIFTDHLIQNFEIE